MCARNRPQVAGSPKSRPVTSISHQSWLQLLRAMHLASRLRAAARRMLSFSSRAAASTCPPCLPAARTHRHACTAAARRSGSSGAGNSSSTAASEQVTRTLLGASSTLMAAGVGPAGLCAFASAVGSSSSSSAADAAPGELPSSTRITFSPVSGEQADALSDCLLGFGAQSVIVEEARQPGGQEQERFGAEAELWDSCTVMAHFGLDHDVAATLDTVQGILELPQLTWSSEQVVDQEWVAQIKASYVPVQVSERLYVVPEWSEPSDPTATNIRLTPGVAFGTGEHPTTKLCLRHLTSLPLAGKALMDYGCGSGVLAIAALLLGAASAVGTDIDPLAVGVASANAALNGVQQRLSVLQCGARLDEPDPVVQQLPGGAGQTFDVVVANILRGPLLELQPRLTAYCRPGGRLVLSGILTEQVPDVVEAYSSAFEGFQVTSEGSWALVTARRRGGGHGVAQLEP